MKTQLNRAAKVALKTASVLADPLYGRFTGPRILIYHQVGVELDREMEVAMGVFRRQLDWMAAHGEIVDLATAIERRGEPEADNLFVLTFDDGFEDVYRNAFPLLADRGLPFTLYLTTKPIETGEPLDSRYPAAKPLQWRQVNEMIATGLVTVGAHTHSHPDLRTIAPGEIADELRTSNELIAKRTGVAPIDFTYPWGYWSPSAHDVVAQFYATATLGAGAEIGAETDKLMLHRFPVQNSDGIAFFAARMRRGLRLEDRVRRRLRRYKGI